ncbi:hypothetical protein TCAL_00750 [Tigriopus californicus]|uniref:E3 ubiquitin-protein ligase Topors n=1 Tax=Tigriopus californicus TaxID=6832 RepID=A0A553P9Z8_TIGCA|nr:hypothetical protein TCAL_00750 [Tigriopus californicus]
MDYPPTPPILTRSDTPPPKADPHDAGPVSGPNTRAKGRISPGDSRCSSPEPHCAICLGGLENMSYTDSCLHKFCFTCLLEWSKVKPECPLCKARFKSIIHNIKADDNYDSYTIPLQPAALAIPNGGTLPPEEERRQPWLARHIPDMNEQAFARMRGMFVMPSLPDNFFPRVGGPDLLPGSAALASGWRRRRHVATSEFRRDIYARHLYVNPASVGDLVTGRFRECSPAWYRNNPATTHRLVPWLNRELNVVMERHPQQIAHVLQLILDSIQQHEIESQEFHDVILPYCGAHTEHFQHEFHHFARSSYDMVGYDRNASYSEQRLPVTRPPVASPEYRTAHVPPMMTIESSSSGDNDDVVIVEEVRSRSQAQTQAGLDTLTDRIHRRLQNHAALTDPGVGSQESASSHHTPSEAPALNDAPSTSSGETSANITRWVVPEANSSDANSDADVDILCEIPSSAKERTPLIGKGKGKGKSSSKSRQQQQKEEIRTKPQKSETFTESPPNSDSDKQKKKRSLKRRKSLKERNSRSRRKYVSSSSSSSDGDQPTRASSSSDLSDDDDEYRMRQEARSLKRKKQKLMLPPRKRRSSNYFGSSDDVATPQASVKKVVTQNPARIVQFAGSSLHSYPNSSHPTKVEPPLASNRVKRKVTLIQPQAVMDQTPMEEFKVESMGTNDLRLKLINRKLKDEIKREERFSSYLKEEQRSPSDDSE